MKIDNYAALTQANSLPKIIKTDNDTKLKEQTDKFEAFFIKKVLDISIKTDNALFPKGAGDEIYRSMYNDALSDKLSGRFGFSELLFNYLKQKS
jgi:Rod binding domain-containing protein